MELSRAQKVRLGAFVLTGMSILCGSAVVLAGLRLTEKRDQYTVRFKGNVGGLEPSSQVRYQGLRVGRVDSMRVDPESPELIEVKLSLEAGTALRVGTRAQLAMSGITGLKNVNLVPENLTDELIPPGSELPEKMSALDEIFDQGPTIARTVTKVALNIAEWTNTDNRLRFQRVLDNLGQLTETVNGILERNEKPIIAAVEQMTDTAVQVSRFTKVTSDILEDNRQELRRTLIAVRGGIENAVRLLKAVDEKELAASVRAARGAMESLDRRLSDAEFGRLVVQLRRNLENVTSLLGEIDLAVRASREDFVLALKRLREASEDIREFSRIIAQDPSVLVRGTELAE